MSHPPHRINHAQTHGANAGQQPAGYPNQERKPEAEPKEGNRKQKWRKQAAQCLADSGNQKHSEPESQQSSNEGNEQRFEQHKQKGGAITEANSLEHRQLADALANRNRHRIAGYQKQGEEDDAADGQNQKFDIAELLGESRGER